MPPTDDMTNGEIGRRLGDLTNAVNALGGKIDQRPVWADIARLEVQRDKADEKRDSAIKALEDAQDSAMRWIITALVGALLSLAVGLVVAFVVR